MLPGMSAKRGTNVSRRSAKPRIAIVGAGNLAWALATSLHNVGYEIEQVISRAGTVSLRKAKRLAAEVGATATALKNGKGTVAIDADIVWFCVPDGAIATAARTLATAVDWSGKVALHSSGALTSDELSALRRRGAAVASAHPMMTFVRGSRLALAGVPFAIEGDRRAANAARAITRNLAAQAYPIRAEDKPAYHAWGTFASPLFTALLATCEQVAAASGVNGNAARQRMLPMLKQTLANYEALGAVGAFSGPIVRGDVATVKEHLRALRKAPIAREVYIALARAALEYLPARNRASLRRVLNVR
jgi:predicted short-subunit dehydrogenase-like oxidoreductase (DUF2520 family)